MKNTPAVFLTSLAVSAFSLTIPLPAATTVLNLFIGEDLTVQHIAQAKEEVRQHTTHQTDGANAKPACPNTVNNTPETVTSNGDSPLADNLEDIKRLLPVGLRKHLMAMIDHTQRPELKYKAYGHLTRNAYMNRKEEGYQLVTGQWLQGVLLKLLASSGPGVAYRLRDVYKGAGASALLFTRCM